MQHFSRPPTGGDEPHEHSLETIIGQLLTFEQIARQQAAELRKACPEAPAPACVAWIQAETASVCWHRCITMLAAVLKAQRSPKQ